MNVGQAITDACRAEMRADQVAMIRRLHDLRDALLAHYWWGWDSHLKTAAKHPKSIHAYSCPRRSPRYREPVGACTCSIMAWRS